MTSHGKRLEPLPENSIINFGKLYALDGYSVTHELNIPLGSAGDMPDSSTNRAALGYRLDLIRAWNQNKRSYFSLSDIFPFMRSLFFGENIPLGKNFSQGDKSITEKILLLYFVNNHKKIARHSLSQHTFFISLYFEEGLLAMPQHKSAPTDLKPP